MADRYEFVGTVRYAYKTEPGAYRYSMFVFLFQRIAGMSLSSGRICEVQRDKYRFGLRGRMQQIVNFQK